MPDASSAAAMDAVFAAAVFAASNGYLGAQVMRVFWPIPFLRAAIRKRQRKGGPEAEEALDVQTWLERLGEREAKAAMPLPQSVAALVLTPLDRLTDPQEARSRRLWARSWLYTFATLAFFYLQPMLFGKPSFELGVTLFLTESLVAFAQALLVKSIADFRIRRIERIGAAKVREEREERERRETEAEEAANTEEIPSDEH